MPAKTENLLEEIWTRDKLVPIGNDLVDNIKNSKNTTSQGKRVTVVKGKYLLRSLCEHKKLLAVDGNDEREKVAFKVASAMMRHDFFFRVERNPDKNETRNQYVAKNSTGAFEPKSYYVWVHKGSVTMRNMYSTLLVLGFLGCCMFPIWPHFLKVALWYLSVTLLLFMLGFSTIRALLAFFAWLLGYDFWVFPNLFDDDRSFCDSFKPGYVLEPTADGQRYYRAAGLVLFVAFCWWVWTQPTDFDRYIHVQREFLDDLYSGELLNDRAQADIDKMDKMPTMEELLREEEAHALDKEANGGGIVDDADMDAMMDRMVSDEMNDLGLDDDDARPDREESGDDSNGDDVDDEMADDNESGDVVAGEEDDRPEMDIGDFDDPI